MSNIFDDYLLNEEDESLSGIGSSLRKIGRKIDKVRRKLTPKPIRNVLSKVNKELRRFIKSDLGKVVAVVAVVVATAYGLGPVVMQGLKAAVAKAGAYAKMAAKAGAKYIAKHATKAGVKKLAIKQAKKQAVKQVFKRGARMYVKRKVGKMQNQMARDQKAYEDQIYKEMEAQFLKDTGHSLNDVQNAQMNAPSTAKNATPPGFVFNKPKPQKPTIRAGRGSRYGARGVMEAYGRKLAIWEKEKAAALRAFKASPSAVRTGTPKTPPKVITRRIGRGVRPSARPKKYSPRSARSSRVALPTNFRGIKLPKIPPKPVKPSIKPATPVNIAKYQKDLSDWNRERSQALSKYVQQNPAQPQKTMQQMMAGIDSMSKSLQAVEASPKYKEAVKEMQARGVPKSQIKKEWLNSETFRQVTTAATVEAFAPMMAESYMRQGYPEEEAKNLAIQETATYGENAASVRKSMAPLAIIATSAAALLTMAI